MKLLKKLIAQRQPRSWLTGWWLLPIAICGGIFLFTPLLSAVTPCINTYCVNWWAIGSGGGTSSGGDYAVTGLAGELGSADQMSGGAYVLQGGFWTGAQSTPIVVTDTPVPPTDTPVPPTDTPVPPTDTPVPPTDVPPTDVPPTDVPPTDVPPTDVPPTNTPIPPIDTAVPPTDTPIPPTNTPVPPTDTPIPPTPTNTPTPIQDAGVDSCVEAQSVTPDGGLANYFFDKAGDVNWLRFDAQAGINYRIEVQIPIDSTADVNLELHSVCNSTPIDQWGETFNPGARLDFRPTADTTLYVRIANYDALIFGEAAKYQVSVRDLREDSSNSATIIVAGRLRGTDRLQDNIHHVTDSVYRMFQGRNYTDENIYYLATDSTLTGYDAAATKESLRAAIISWAAARVSVDGVLNLYMVDHGSPENFYIDEVSGQRVSPTELDEWLSDFEGTLCDPKNCTNPPRINVFIEACQSGSFIDPVGGNISQPNRTVIASTSAQNDAKASRDGAYFSDHLITELSQGKNVFSSFIDAQTNANLAYSLQEAWLDADGDGTPNELDDGNIAAQRGFVYANTLGENWAPYTFTVQPPSELSESSGIIRADVRDNQKVSLVWAVVYPPDYVPTAVQGELQAETLDNFILTATSDADQYEGRFSGFTQEGTYRILVHAEDNDGFKARPVEIEVVVGGKEEIYLPIIVE